MNERLKKSADRVLKENGIFWCRDSHIGEMLMNAGEAERLHIIREEYAKIIETDEESLLAGQYPAVLFSERRKQDITPAKKPIPEEYENFFMRGGYHFSVDFEYIIKNGISGLLNQIDVKRRTVTTEDEKDFLDDLSYAAQSVIAWAQAHSDALKRTADKATSEKRREELLRMADVCRRVPELPSASFYEAIQSYFFVFMLFPDGLGRLDQYLYPYYLADVKKGILTRKEALDLIEELFIKIFGYLGKDAQRSAENHGVIAGYTPDGECGHNECTSLILEAVTELPTWRPQVSYRVTKKTTAEQLEEALEANTRRPDLVMFLNDDPIVNGLMSAGVDYEDAVNYSSSGCNETVLTGCSHMGALEGHMNIMHSLENMLKDTALLEKIHNFDEFYKEYEGYLYNDLDYIFRLSEEVDFRAAQRLLPVKSLFTTGCIDSATSITRGGAKYNYCTWCLTGIINLADSLSIIRQMVFEEKRFSLTDLSRFIAANWEGYECQRSYILNNGRYFGNDDDYVDLLINKVGKSVNEFAEKYTPYRGGSYMFGTLTGYELSHLYLGKESGASPDGRYAGDPFAASVAAFPGADRNGMTAYLKSAAKIDETLMQSSVVVNLKMNRVLVQTEENRKRLLAVLRTYFELGGIHLQINYVSADELIKAQQTPEHYQGLRVRVTGFSGFFTSFDKDLQDEIVKRYLHMN